MNDKSELSRRASRSAARSLAFAFTAITAWAMPAQAADATPAPPAPSAKPPAATPDAAPQKPEKRAKHVPPPVADDEEDAEPSGASAAPTSSLPPASAAVFSGTQGHSAAPATPPAEAAPTTADTPPAAAPPAPVRTDMPAPKLPDDGRLGTHQSHLIFGVGYRQAFVRQSGLDLFSDDDAVPQLSLSAGHTLFASDRLSFAALGIWDWGSLSSTARGSKTVLYVNRVTLGLEGRYHFVRRLYAFGRIAPGALNTSATLADRVVGLDRTSSGWSFASDFSAGAAFEFAGDARGASNHPRGWFAVDGGYGFATSSKLDFKTTDPNAGPVRLQPVHFGDLAIRGPFFRLAALITY
jgi:hypothetical protein